MNDTIFCDNCSSEIATTNFLLHNLHCLKFKIKCSYCEKVLIKQDYDKHYNQYHKLITCICGAQIEPVNKKNHDSNECLNRIVACSFCEFPCFYYNLNEHEDTCKSRTDTCKLCGGRFTLLELKTHECNLCNQYDCMLCDNFYPTVDLLQVHIQTEH